MRRFVLWRRNDATGVSGPGAVAEGVIFGDGTCALRWRTSKRSSAVYDSFDDLLSIHGHDGATIPLWLDGEDEAPRTSTEYLPDPNDAGHVTTRDGVAKPVCWVKSGATDAQCRPLFSGTEVRLLRGKPDRGVVNSVYVEPSNAVMVSVAGVSPCNQDAFPIEEVEKV
jgi:hypothetical protein